jgi:hypothetical protein
MQVMAQEIGIAGFLSAFPKHCLSDIGITQILQPVNAATCVNVRSGFDIEGQNI